MVEKHFICAYPECTAAYSTYTQLDKHQKVNLENEIHND